MPVINLLNSKQLQNNIIKGVFENDMPLYGNDTTITNGKLLQKMIKTAAVRK